MKGSITAEAACVCPLIFFTLVLVWYLGCFQHNRITCQAVCQEAAYKGLDALQDGRDAKAAARNVLEMQKAAIFAAETVNSGVSVSDTKIRVSMTVSMRFPFDVWKGSAVGEGWLIEEQTELSAESPVKKIRRLKRLKTIRGEGVRP